MKQRLGSMYNMVSLTGVILAIGAAGLMVAFLAMEEIVGSSNPYAGLVYFTFPVMFALGLLLVLAGALRTRRRRHLHGLEEEPLPKIDFNDPHHRLKFVFFGAAVMVFLLIISITAIKGYEYTESTEFCGKLCCCRDGSECSSAKAAGTSSAAPVCTRGREICMWLGSR